MNVIEDAEARCIYILTFEINSYSLLEKFIKHSTTLPVNLNGAIEEFC